jgi:hypothetical protein
MNEVKQLFSELEIKDKIISGSKGLFKMVEGDIAKLAVKEYENSLKMIRYLANDND